MKCAIRWIDDTGKPTDDDNEAVARVWVIAHTEYHGGRNINYTESEHFPCCAEHLKLLAQPGMQWWRSEPIEKA